MAKQIVRTDKPLRSFSVPKFLSFSVPKFLSFSVPKFLSFLVSQFPSFSVSQFLGFSVPKFLSFSIPKFLSFLVSQFSSFSVSQFLSSQVTGRQNKNHFCLISRGCIRCIYQSHRIQGIRRCGKQLRTAADRPCNSRVEKAQLPPDGITLNFTSGIVIKISR
jgi:hypothetical protein